MCNDNDFFFKSQSSRYFYYLSNTGVRVIMLPNNFFYSNLVQIPRLFLATFNVAVFPFVEETCCKFFSTKGQSAKCKEQRYNEQGCPYQHEEIHGPGSRVKALWWYRYDHIMNMSKKKSASKYKSKSYYWLQIYTVHNLNLMHHISKLYLVYKWVKQRYNLLDWLFLINLGKPDQL